MARSFRPVESRSIRLQPYRRQFATLIFALGLVLVLMYEARKPENWTWLTGPAENRPALLGAADEEIDTRLARTKSGEVVPGTFIARREPAPPEQDARPFPEIDHSLFDTVRDNTIFRRGDHAAWFHLLKHLADTPLAEIESASTATPTFAQLYRQSSVYRGKLVTVRGIARRAQRVDAPGNDVGIDDYYQVWIQPADSPTNPVVVYCLELPAEFPIAESINETVALTGFFFKRWAYTAQDTERIAPLLIARSVTWTRQRAAQLRAFSAGEIAALVVAALFAAALVVALVLYTSAKGARRHRQVRRAASNAADEPSFPSQRAAAADSSADLPNDPGP